jgi:DNA-directed RNA polymerase subunit N (RpoN/RPB10)
MNAEKKVFNKLFKKEKTELSTQKVELKNLNVLKAKSRWLSEWVRTGNTIAKEYEKLSKRRKSSLNNLQEAFNEYGSDIRETEKALNDLGIKDTPKELIDAKNLLKEVAKAANALKL